MLCSKIYHHKGFDVILFSYKRAVLLRGCEEGVGMPTNFIPDANTLHSTPCTLHPTPYTLHTTPHSLHPTPSMWGCLPGARRVRFRSAFAACTSAPACVCVRERERVRERKREISVCVCVSEREKDKCVRERERERDKVQERFRGLHQRSCKYGCV
jgi:hypothetical protein